MFATFCGPDDWLAYTKRKLHNAVGFSNKADSVFCINSCSPHGHSSGTHIWGRAFDVLREFLYNHSHSACSRNGCHSHSSLLFRGSICYKVKCSVWEFRKEKKRHKKIDLDHTCFLRKSGILVAHEEGMLKCYSHAELGTLRRVPFLYGFKTNKNRNMVNLGRYRQQAESERGETPGQI